MPPIFCVVTFIREVCGNLAETATPDAVFSRNHAGWSRRLNDLFYRA
jgi:hypothetical protein